MNWDEKKKWVKIVRRRTETIEVGRGNECDWESQKTQKQSEDREERSSEEEGDRKSVDDRMTNNSTTHSTIVFFQNYISLLLHRLCFDK